MRGGIFRWSQGYIHVRVAGYSGERFFNLCKSAGLAYWRVRRQGDGYCFYISRKDFFRLRPILRKSHMSMRILSREGLPFALRRNRKRKALAGAVLSFFVLIYAMSLFIWDVSFDGNYYYTREVLLDYLEEQGIRYGMMKHKISCDDLEEGIRSRFPEITWVSARVSGTRLLVKLKENQVLSSIPEADSQPCHITASTSGTITRMIIRQGKAKVRVGDPVEAGQQLVAGQLSVTNDAGEVIRTAWVHADADIYARTVYGYDMEFPRYHRVDVKTGKNRYGFVLAAGPWRFTLLAPDFERNSWNYRTNITQLHLFEDFYLPVYMGRIRGEAYVSYERPYTDQEKEQLSEKVRQDQIENLMEKGVQIIENNVKIQEYGVSWKVEGTIVAEEQIGVKRYITEYEETRETDERN